MFMHTSVQQFRINVFIPKELKGNDTVQLHFNYSYKLRIFFHTVRFAYDKMKDAKTIECFH